MCKSKLEKLWTSLKSGKEIKVEKKYFVSLPTEEAQQLGISSIVSIPSFRCSPKAKPIHLVAGEMGTTGSTTPVFQVLRQ